MPIYEGTNAIQAQDLLGRKVIRDKGWTLNAMLNRVNEAVSVLPKQDERCKALAEALSANVSRVRNATRFVLIGQLNDRELVGSVAVNYLMLLGYVLGGWQLALLATAVHSELPDTGDDRTYRQQLLDAAGFYAAHVLPRAQMHSEIVQCGSRPVVRGDADLQ